jgi:hypothetical protein
MRYVCCGGQLVAAVSRLMVTLIVVISAFGDDWGLGDNLVVLRATVFANDNWYVGATRLKPTFRLFRRHVSIGVMTKPLL